LIVVYKTSWINYLLIKPFVKIKFGNILNIIANKEVIPELIQQRCNSNEIFEQATKLIDSELLRKELVSEYNKILDKIIVPDSLNKISDCLLE
jgi:lipid-A-disaccharide synthase